LIEARARVIGIEPTPLDLPELEILVESYRPDHLTGASLVFAAATPDVNGMVVADARARGIWVNSASEPSAGDFRLPATWQDGPISVSVSTSGASPALAATLRDRAAEAIGPSASGLATLLLELRPEVLARVRDPAARRRALTAGADPRWLEFLDREGVDSTRQALRRALGLG
jgi:siroheme synthase-like protein